MELKGPIDVGKCTYFLQTTLICLGSVLCAWEYNRTGFRNHPYLIVLVCVCVCPCVFTVTLSLFWLACPAWLISSNHKGLIDQQILLLSFCCVSCFHSDASIIVAWALLWICTIPLFLRRAAGQNHYFCSFSSSIEKLKVITDNFFRFSLLLTDTTQEWVKLYPLHESCVCCSRHPGDGSSSLENPVLNSKWFILPLQTQQ